MASDDLVTIRTVSLPHSRLVIDIADEAARLRDPLTPEEEWTPATAEPRIVAIRTHRDMSRWRRRATTAVFGTGTSDTVAGITGRTGRRRAQWPVTWVADTFWYADVAAWIDDVEIYG